MARANRAYDVQVDMTPLRRFTRDMRRGMRGGAGEINTVWKQLGVRYLAFARRRFQTFSQGGGDWPPLKASTKRQRRKARQGYRGSRTFAILRDTGTLFNALLLGAPGNILKRIANGVRVGIGGGSKHPAGPTIGQLAEYHNEGKGVPERVIVPDELDASTRRGFTSDIKRAIARMGRKAGRRS